MSNQWLRLWHDMPTDPKWRTIARISKQPIANVIAVYLHMLVCASNATERGRTHGWNDEDVASALDIETENVATIRESMQGRVLENDYLTGWEKRQPKREDNSSLRAKEWRDRQKEERNRTQPNAEKRPEEDKDTDKNKKVSKALGSRFALTEMPPEWKLFCESERPDLDPAKVFSEFRDYWIAVPGQRGRKTDWLATWRNRVRDKKKTTTPQEFKSFEQKAKDKTDEAMKEVMKRYAQPS